MRSWYPVPFLLVFCFAPHFSSLAFAQGAVPQAAVPSPQATATAAKTADHNIHLDVVVTDKSGAPVSGLQQADFTLLDDKQPRAITSFRGAEETGKPSEPPVQVIFLLDAVNASYRVVTIGRDQLAKFLRRDGGKLSQPTSLVIFTDTSTMIQPKPVGDGNGLADTLKSNQTGLRISGRSQGFYGAVDRMQMSIRTVKQIAAFEAAQPGRKILIWISPGWPLLTGPGVELTAKEEDMLFNSVVGLSATLREARVVLYSVDPLGMADAATIRTSYYEMFLKGPASARKTQGANLTLQVLAVQSGGKVLNSSNDIVGLIASCWQDTKAFYTLTFDSPPADHPDEYHSLEIKVDKPGLIARTRTGYYAEPYKEAGR